jgi:cytochrome c oxidase cbb3-type subunit IV
VKSLGLSYFTDTYLTSIGLLIFFGFFMAVVIWTSRRDSQALYSKVQNQPLEGEDESR